MRRGERKRRNYVTKLFRICVRFAAVRSAATVGEILSFAATASLPHFHQPIAVSRVCHLILFENGGKYEFVVRRGIVSPVNRKYPFLYDKRKKEFKDVALKEAYQTAIGSSFQMTGNKYFNISMNGKDH